MQQVLMSQISLCVSSLVEVSYSPVLLLDARFDASYTDHADFASACRSGFEGFFEQVDEALEGEYEGFSVVGVPSWEYVEQSLRENVLRRYDRHERLIGVTSLPWRVGFYLGWLSALALMDRSFALRGLAVLQELAVRQQKEEQARGYNPYASIEGLIFLRPGGSVMV